MTIRQAFEIAVQRHQEGRLIEAEALYRQILVLQPNHSEALHFLGVIAHQFGRDEAAVELILKAIVLNPNNPAAHSNLGEAYRSLGRLDEAILTYRHALALKPDIPETCLNLGNALIERGHPDEGIAAYRHAIELNRDYLEAQNNLGNALREQGQHDEAIAAYRQALKIRTEAPQTHSNLIFALHFHPEHCDASLAEEREQWNRRFGEPLGRLMVPHANDSNPERRLRIGYVSPDFRDHVVGRNLLPLFECHDLLNFEVLCYSGVARSDELTEEFRRRSHHWRSTVGVGDDALADMIKRDNVDILVDLSQHTAGNRLPMFARKPAPVQVSFAGYPESTGVGAIDYRISDWYLEGGAADEGAVTKERLCLIDSFWCYDPRGERMKVNPLPALRSKTVTFGCMNRFSKVNERALSLWARVLAKVSDSQMVLLSNEGSHRRWVLAAFEREAVEARRIEFVEPRPRTEYLELYQRLDIALDTFPYNGHTTSLDALWMGVPVVSLAGGTRVSRAGLSQLSNLGLPELVAHSESEYVDIAKSLGGDLSRLAELRSTLRDRMKGSVLMDAPRFARQIETAYREMWRAWCSAQRPIRTDIGPPHKTADNIN